MTAPMSIEAWCEQVAAARPPLSAAQLAILRPLWRTPSKTTAPATDAGAESPVDTEPEGVRHARAV